MFRTYSTVKIGTIKMYIYVYMIYILHDKAIHATNSFAALGVKDLSGVGVITVGVQGAG